MAELTACEQLLLELVNRARLDPLAEANRLGIKLNEDLPGGTISSSSKQPVAPNGEITDASRAHTEWMLQADVFSHTGVNGSSACDRLIAAGYEFADYWCYGENIAWVSKGTTSAKGAIQKVHDNLFLSAGHRANLLYGDHREFGAGVETGKFYRDGTTYDAWMATETFARSGTNTFITGVAIDDRDGDNFYDIGEGRGDVVVTVLQGGAIVGSGTTMAAGGYAAAIATTGTLDVEFSGPSLAQPMSVSVNAGTKNIKLDLVDENKILSSESVTLGDGAAALVLLGAGNLDGSGNELSNSIKGNRGHNDLYGGQGHDNLSGGDGNDTLRGDAGNDVLKGSSGNDTLRGDEGNDVLAGGNGRDVLIGGEGSDRFDFNERAIGSQRDTITDFRRGVDEIDLRTVDAKSGVSGNQAFKWIGTKSFHDVKGELHYKDLGSRCLVEGDINGDGKADFQVLVKVGSLGHGDFLL